MALTETTKIDEIKIVGDFKHLEILTALIIERDGVEISRIKHRHVVFPGGDLTNQDAEVQGLANLLHTQEIIDAYQAFIEVI